MKGKTLTIGMVVGESSGDILGANLIKQIKEVHPNAQFLGIGGPLMIAEGFTSWFEMERLSVMGLFEPLKRLPELLAIRREVIAQFTQHPPDIFIGVDSPDFNLSIEKKLKQKGVKTLHYVGPSVWAWRQGRIHTIKKAVDKVLVLFPFEKSIYEKHGIPVECVGHPLASRIPLSAQRFSEPSDDKHIAILPGSRLSEIRYMAKPFIQTAKWIVQHFPRNFSGKCHFHVAAANANIAKKMQHMIDQTFPEGDWHITIGNSGEVLTQCDCALLTSGTIALEAMLYKKPMVVAYKLSNLSYYIAKQVIKVNHISLPNLLANKEIVPELIQKAATPSAMGRTILQFLLAPNQNKPLIQKFNELHESIKASKEDAVAQAVLGLL